MKKINLEILITMYDTDPKDEPVQNKMDTKLMDLEDSFHSMQFGTIKSLSKFTENPDISLEENLKIKFDKAHNWVNKESSLNPDEKKEVCDFIKKDLPFYIFKCDNVVKISENLSVEKEGEGWIDNSGNVSGFSGATLAGKVDIEYDFELLTKMFDDVVKTFQERSGITIPKNTFSIINFKESVDTFDNVKFTEDNVLKFCDLDKSDVKIKINSVDIKNKNKSKLNK
jgi:hypothetical protein